VAESTGYSAYWIGQLAKRYNTAGPSDMRNRALTDSYRRPPLLNATLQEELRMALQGAPPGGQALWTARVVAAWMSERLGRPVAVQRGSGMSTPIRPLKRGSKKGEAAPARGGDRVS
jgi:hypothetical protein